MPCDDNLIVKIEEGFTLQFKDSLENKIYLLIYLLFFDGSNTSLQTLQTELTVIIAKIPRAI